MSETTYSYTYNFKTNGFNNELKEKCNYFQNGKLVSKTAYKNTYDDKNTTQYFYKTLEGDNTYEIVKGNSVNYSNWNIIEMNDDIEMSYKLEYDKNKFLTSYPKKTLRRSERLMKKKKTNGYKDPIMKEIKHMEKLFNNKYHHNVKRSANLYDMMY